MATTPSSAPSAPMRAIDRLRKAANFEPIKQVVELVDGSEFVFYATPLTAADDRGNVRVLVEINVMESASMRGSIRNYLRAERVINAITLVSFEAHD